MLSDAARDSVTPRGPSSTTVRRGSKECCHYLEGTRGQPPGEWADVSLADAVDMVQGEGPWRGSERAAGDSAGLSGHPAGTVHPTRLWRPCRLEESLGANTQVGNELTKPSRHALGSQPLA